MRTLEPKCVRGGAITLTALATLLFFRCGHAGDSGVEAPPVSPPQITGTVDTSVKTLSGAIYVGDTSHPAVDYEIWLLDHTTSTFLRAPVTDTGVYRFDLEAFPEGDIFSLHVIDHMRHIADVDLSDALGGTQGAFTYGGGSGFIMRDLVVPVTTRGDIDRDVDVVTGSIGGGFALRTSVATSIDDVATAAHTKVIAIGSQLFVFDPTTMLTSFVQRASNPTAYSRDLAGLSRIGIYALADADDRFLAGDVVEGGSWLDVARAASITSASGAAGGLWSATGFEMNLVSPRELSQSVLLGDVPAGDEMAIVRLRPSDGSAEPMSPRRIGKIVGVPPIVVAAAADGGSPSTLDYASSTAPNGLTRAFCRKGDVTIDVEPPRDVKGSSLAGSFDRIEVGLDYFSTGDDGRKKTLASSAAAFPSPFNANKTDAYGADSRRVWSPATAIATFELGATDKVASQPRLVIPSALLLTKIGNEDVGYIRMRIIFRTTSGAIAAGTGFWLYEGC